MGRLIEGVWDCAYCGSKKIRGSIRICPVCGRQRDDNIRFYMDNPHNYVDEEVAKTINRKPDWYCSYCDALNSDDVHECHICGSSRADSEQNYFERKDEIDARRAEKKRMDEEARGHTDAASQNDEPRYDVAPNGLPIYRGYAPIDHQEEKKSFEWSKENLDTPEENIYKSMSSEESGSYPHISKPKRTSSASSAFKNAPWGNIFKIGAGILAAIMIIMCIGWAFTPKIQEVTIQDFSWERSISIEEYVTVERNDWYLPADGRLLYSQQEIKGYEQVLDHYETETYTYTEKVFDHYEYSEVVTGYRDLGNGYFEEITTTVQEPVYRTETRTGTREVPVYRDEPIYATKYYYEIDVWQYAFSYNTSGSDKDPYWKEFTLKDLQREGGRSETYYITVLNEEGEEDKYHFDFDTWNSLEVGETVAIKTTIFGGAELVVDGEVVSEATEGAQTTE